MSAVALIACGVALGIALSGVVLATGSMIFWRADERREREAAAAADRRRGEVRRATGKVETLADHRRRA